MSASRPELYEGMFLLNPTAIQSNVSQAMDIIRTILERAEAEVESMYKWDERKLAYPIDGQKRGLYILAYFRVRGTMIPNIERDVTLSEELLRSLILRADHIGEAELALAKERDKETRSVAAMGEGGEGAETGETPEVGPAEAAAAPAAPSGDTSGDTPGEAAAAPAPEAGDEADKAPEAEARSE